MASPDDPSATTCGICSELFDDPRMLQCLHSFCCKCLKTVAKGSTTRVECPICKKATPLKTGGVDGLLKDLRKSYEAEVAQYARKIQSKEEKSCDQCVDMSNGPAVSFCMECCEFLCKYCSKHHKIWRKTLSHELQPVGGAHLASKVLNLPHKPMNCQLHKRKTLEYYCETCSALICRDCMDFHHKSLSGHKCDCVEPVAEKERTALKSIRGNADNAKAKLDSAIADGNKVIQCIQGKQKSIEEGIDSAFKALDDALERRKIALLAKAAEISSGKQTALTIQGEKFKTLRQELVEISATITRSTEVYTDEEMLSVKGAITSKLQELLKEYRSLDLLPCKSNIMPSVLDTSNVAGIIGSFGLVLGGSYPGEAKTDLHIPRAIKFKQKRVTITTCDIQGKSFPYGDERVEVTLSLLGSKQNDPPLSATVVDKKNGTYTALFIPRSKGEHRLSISIDSHHIKGSPFPVFVREARDYTKGFSCQTAFSASSYVFDVAVDDNGDVYVAVCGNSTIQIFNKDGKQIDDRTIGTEGDGDGQLNYPCAIAIRGSVLYVAECNNHRVQKLTTSGKFISKFGVQDSGDGKQHLLNNPRGICLDKDGRIYVSDGGNNRISVFEPDGKLLYHITGTTDKSKLNSPWGLAFDQGGNLHVADSGTNTIKIFTPQGQYIDQYNSGVNSPAGIVIDVEGNTTVTEHYYQHPYHYSQLCILDAQHKVITTTRPSNIQNATGVTIDKEGSIYVCSLSNSCIYKY